MAEKLRSSYLNYAKKIGLKLKVSKKKHLLRLYKDKSEFGTFNVATGWAEAYYFNLVLWIQIITKSLVNLVSC
jgi:hypothetical protein